jgi:predicted ATPase/class 3 adenylate cyclase
MVDLWGGGTALPRVERVAFDLSYISRNRAGHSALMVELKEVHMASLPLGTVTFLFSDLEGSTRLWEDRSHTMHSALARHDEILRTAVDRHGGAVVKGTGDGIHAAFPTPEAALGAAIDAQRALATESWEGLDPLRVRMGVHVGSAEHRDGDYFGPAVNRAARLMQAAHGGQIVVSGATEEITRGTLPGDVFLLDLGRHRLRDLAQPDHLFQVVGPGLQSTFPPLRSVDSFPNNLPAATTSFVGRDLELRDVIAALREHRVVTLTGVGGVGKTRLALQVAAEVLPRFSDGAWLCELGPVSDANAVPALLAATLSLQTRAGRSALDTVLDGLRHQHALLVLDNCEHVIGSAARLVDAIVRGCKDVRILATSREGLGIAGERLMLVPSLEIPDDIAPASTGASGAAVELFVDRATSARRGFALTEENLSAIVQLCRRLDGIPLAIELAAARTRMMTAAEIADRLDERFRLLTGGSRTAVERHQTLRAAVDWSYDLLEPGQRSLLNHLGVFAGGFTVAGAEAIADDDATGLVLEHLGQLIDKSLVIAEDDEHGESRYRLLETIRQYAVAHLDEEGITDSVRRRHAAWLTRFVVDATARSHGPEEATWTRRLRRELENLRAAITWATGADETDLAMELLGRLELAQWPNSRMLFALGSWADAALATPGALGNANAPAVLALRAADHLLHGRIDDAERDALDAIELAKDPQTRFTPYPWGVLLRIVAVAEGHGSAIFSRHEELVATTRARGDRFEQAFALFIASMALTVNGHPELAEPYAKESLLIAQEIGAPSIRSAASTGLALALGDRDPERAAALAEISLANALEIDHGMGLMVALNLIGRLAGGARDPEWSMRFRHVLDATHEAGDARLVATLLDSYALALAANDMWEPAAVLYGLQLPGTAEGPTHLARVRREQLRDRLLVALGQDRVDALIGEAQRMTLEDAIAFARAELDHVIAMSSPEAPQTE